MRIRWFFFTLGFWLAGSVSAGELLLSEKRQQAMRQARIFHFEPGGTAVDNRDLDNDKWPDFWIKIVDDNHSSYLADHIAIVEDPQRVGRYGVPGNVLRVPFDGTGVALETREPITIDAEMSYVITAFARTQNLNKSIAGITAQWVRISETNESVLGTNFLPVPPGQVDWSESPLKIHINRVPPGATHLRLIISIYADPQYDRADRQGAAWFDDIIVTPRPKIYMEPTFRDYSPSAAYEIAPPPFEFTINYRGLIDNIPPEERTGGMAKSYYRVIDIIDINGNAPRDRRDRVIRFNFQRRREIYPGALDTYPEKIPISLDKLGVYYLTVTLYGYRGELLTERTQVLGLWQPALKRDATSDEASVSSGFGVVIDDIPFVMLQKEGALAALVERTGARYVKANLWPSPRSGENIDPKFFVSALTGELEQIRRNGVRVTAIMEPPSEVLGTQTLYSLMRDAPQNLASFINTITDAYDPQIENWQWGADNDPAFSNGIVANEIKDARTILARQVSNSAQSFPVAVSIDNSLLPSPEISFAASIFVPALYTENRLIRELIKLLPTNFTRFHDAARRLYPPQWLLSAAPYPEPTDDMKLVERKLENWVSCELQAVPSETHVPRIEREVLADMARKVTLIRVADISRVYIKSLLSPTNGLAALDQDNNPIPLPALLGLRVLDEYLSGATYLGSFNLFNENGLFPNFVFARPNGTAFAVVWYEGKGREEAELDFGGGFRLNVVDLQGNIRPLPANSRFIATRTPQIVAGMSIPYARTRLSINILREPMLFMQSQDQRQLLTITNFFTTPISGEVTVDYAARSTSFIYEENWRVNPVKLSFNLPRPLQNEPQTVQLPYEVRPPNTSTLDEGQETGEKIASLRVALIGDHPENLRLLRPIILSTDVSFSLKMLATPEDQDTNILQMATRWVPDEKSPHKHEILLRPFYRIGNDLETLLPTMLVPAYRRDDDDTPPTNIEYRLPKNVPYNLPVWIGYRQEDGPRFLNYNINSLLRQLDD